MNITQFFSKLLPQLSKCVVSGTIISPGGTWVKSVAGYVPLASQKPYSIRVY